MSQKQGQTYYDYRKFAVLYVDDEEMSLMMVKRAYGAQFRIFTASSADEGLKMLLEHQAEIGVLMTDQQMPDRTGVWLLEQARRQCPMVVRILATAYSNMDAAIAAVNSGGIYYYVTKPWDPGELEVILKRALEFFLVRKERDELLRQQLSVMRNAMIADRILGLGFLASGLSHHMRNMLVAVKTFLDLAPEKLQEEKLDVEEMRDPEFWRDYYHSAQGQIDKIVALLEDLWSASEKHASQMTQMVRLHPLVEAAIQRRLSDFQKKQIEVVNRIPGELPELQADEPRFRKMFDLLLKDEASMLPRESRVEISAELLPASDGQAEQVVIQVTDNGPGLPQDQVRMVFDPFMARSDSPGEYGINLMACFFIVHRHGGKIEASSAEGGGTCFTIRIPTRQAAVGQVKHNEEFLQKLLLNQTNWDQILSAER